MEKVLVCLFVLSSLLFGEESSFKVKSLSSLKTEDVTLQRYEESCGAATLATMMNLYGEEVSEEVILKRISQKTDMLSFLEMAQVAEGFGYKASAYKITSDIFDKLSIPVIAKIDNHEGISHFVVVVNYDGDFVTVLDPSFGRFSQHKKEFFHMWQEQSQGYILIMIPEVPKQAKPIDLKLPEQAFFRQK